MSGLDFMSSQAFGISTSTIMAPQTALSPKLVRIIGGGVAVIVHPWRLQASAGTCIVGPQQVAYVHAAFCHGHKHRWMAFIDTDEFIVPRQHRTIIEALDCLERYSNISLSGSQFGHCGHAIKPSEPCAFAYMNKHQSAPIAQHFKCIVDPSKLSMISVHYCLTADMGSTTANDKGQVEENIDRPSAAGFISSEFLPLNHYATKSLEEHERKLGKILYNDLAEERRSRVQRQLHELSTDVVKDTAILDFLRRHGINNSQEYSQYINGTHISETPSGQRSARHG